MHNSCEQLAHTGAKYNYTGGTLCKTPTINLDPIMKTTNVAIIAMCHTTPSDEAVPHNA